jgi:hypothetical protein
VSEKRNRGDRRAAEAVKAQGDRTPPPQPKTQHEDLDEQALDDVLRKCPL